MKFNHPYDIIKTPVLTEESTIQTESNNKYTFRVDPRANKREIRDAVEQQFDVHVLSINTMNYSGKKRTSRTQARVAGRTSSWKKAIVTLREGDTIDLI